MKRLSLTFVGLVIVVASLCAPAANAQSDPNRIFGSWSGSIWPGGTAVLFLNGKDGHYVPRVSNNIKFYDRFNCLTGNVLPKQPDRWRIAVSVTATTACANGSLHSFDLWVYQGGSYHQVNITSPQFLVADGSAQSANEWAASSLMNKDEAARSMRQQASRTQQQGNQVAALNQKILGIDQFSQTVTNQLAEHGQRISNLEGTVQDLTNQVATLRNEVHNQGTLQNYTVQAVQESRDAVVQVNTRLNREIEEQAITTANALLFFKKDKYRCQYLEERNSHRFLNYFEDDKTTDKWVRKCHLEPKGNVSLETLRHQARYAQYNGQNQGNNYPEDQSQYVGAGQQRRRPTYGGPDTYQTPPQ